MKGITSQERVEEVEIGGTTTHQMVEEEKKEMTSIENDKWTDFTTAQLTATTKKLANWKAPGIDQVQNFWIKYLTALHPTLIKNANEIINKPDSAPQWLMTGTTTIIHKSGPTNNAKNK